MSAQRVIEEARLICSMAAPTGAEEPRAQLVAELFVAAGAEPARDSAGNVIVCLGSGPEPESVVFAAHLDTVFDASTEIVFDERDGRLGAPGIGDNSLGVAALLHLARHLAARELDRRAILAATVGEEGLGDLRGARALLDGRGCDAFIAVEGQMLASIQVAAVGSRRFRARLRGPGGHSWGDRGTPSAVHGLVDGLAAVIAELAPSGVVFNAGVIGGGTGINVIAAHATAELDLRSESEADLERAVEAMRERLQAAATGLELELEPLGHRPAGRIDPRHALLDAARRARERAGLPAAREEASSTDANAAYGRGIPAIAVGVTTGGNAHRPDEYIDLEPVAAGLAALTELADELAPLGR